MAPAPLYRPCRPSVCRMLLMHWMGPRNVLWLGRPTEPTGMFVPLETLLARCRFSVEKRSHDAEVTFYMKQH